MARLHLHVSPSSGRNALEMQPNGEYRAYISARAVDGKANRALLLMLAEQFGLPKSRLTIVRGAASRHKVVEIDGLDDREARTILETKAREPGRPAPGNPLMRASNTLNTKD